jgi:hypothetical protein
LNSGAITTLSNGGTIQGFDGVENTNSIGTLSNLKGGKISGLFAGLSNAGKISTLTNNGTIGGKSYAIYSIGSIGPIINSGSIVGNVQINNQAKVYIAGGSGTTFGSLRGGTITIGNGSLTFAGGNTNLADNIAVDGGAGTVTNEGLLQLATAKKITGNFAQTASGAFDSLIAGDTAGKYGSLTVTKLGRLALDLTNGFTLAAGDSFELFNFAGLSFTSPTHDFRTLAFDGANCLDHGGGVWSCANLGPLHFAETITANALDLNVVAGPLAITNSLAISPVATSAIPEPSTWIMLATGFLGLAGLGLRDRAASLPARRNWTRSPTGARCSWSSAARTTRRRRSKTQPRPFPMRRGSCSARRTSSDSKEAIP